MPRITAARVIVIWPGQNFVTLRMMYPRDAPGPGVEIDEELAARYEYKRAFRPVNRQQDGTMFSW